MNAYPFLTRSMYDVCRACGKQWGRHYTRHTDGKTLCNLNECSSEFRDLPEIAEIDAQMKQLEERVEYLLKCRKDINQTENNRLAEKEISK